MAYQIYIHHKRLWLASSFSLFMKKPHECRQNNGDKCHTAHRNYVCLCRGMCRMSATLPTIAIISFNFFISRVKVSACIFHREICSTSLARHCSFPMTKSHLKKNKILRNENSYSNNKCRRNVTVDLVLSTISRRNAQRTGKMVVIKHRWCIGVQMEWRRFVLIFKVSPRVPINALKFFTWHDTFQHICKPYLERPTTVYKQYQNSNSSNYFNEHICISPCFLHSQWHLHATEIATIFQ